jgi:hypothetical protein
MDITSALNRIEVVLNQYHAFIEVKEALEAAVNAERVVVEAGLKADGLRTKIAELEGVKAGVIAEIKAAKIRAADDARISLDRLVKQQMQVVAEINEAKDKYNTLLAQIGDTETVHSTRVAEMHKVIEEMQAKADAEVARYTEAKAGLAALRERL